MLKKFTQECFVYVPDPIKLLIWGEMLGLAGPRLRKNLPQAFVITVNYATLPLVIWSDLGSPLLKRSPCHSVSQAVCSFRHPLHHRQVASKKIGGGGLIWMHGHALHLHTHFDGGHLSFCDFSGATKSQEDIRAKEAKNFQFTSHDMINVKNIIMLPKKFK